MCTRKQSTEGSANPNTVFSDCGASTILRRAFPHLPHSTLQPARLPQGLRTLDLSLDDLKARFKKHVIAASLQCSGNRRDEMNKVWGFVWVVWRPGLPAARLAGPGLVHMASQLCVDG
eukprot:96223-Chlamydomonas_euryale.AAC.2